MAINVIRPATKSDTAAVAIAAVRFCRRHNIALDGNSKLTTAVAAEIEWLGADHKIKNLWQRAFCRALGEPYSPLLTIAHSSVGHHIID